MAHHKILASVLVATTMLGSVAYAAEQAARPATVQESQARKTADKDVGRLSKDGAQAFRDIHLARVAIFDADPTRAKDLIGKAQSALTKAKADEAVFMKAEADLRGPAGIAAGKAPNAGDAASDGKADATPAATDAVAWLPIDAQLSLGESFVATPEKAAAVADANKSLHKGDKQAALEKLKLADINVTFTMAVLPLDKTTADVDQAASLIGQGKYYEANALLKSSEDRMRFDVVDAVAVPKTAGAKATETKAGETKATETRAATTKGSATDTSDGTGQAQTGKAAK